MLPLPGKLSGFPVMMMGVWQTLKNYITHKFFSSRDLEFFGVGVLVSGVDFSFKRNLNGNFLILSFPTPLL